ncbi:MFS transporter [Cohaesibacter celericrescens]|uniref:MFS transporter n=1 Tax=Cohaesibacter celericrescens TaxID=2067669 RepID=A0A2N5XRH6_9HYPH|nr:MFS transporter [Cohaesibacter celericrescens]PLW77122.1 MFS transporter [Cohaesibacter celericrescens]
MTEESGALTAEQPAGGSGVSASTIKSGFGKRHWMVIFFQGMLFWVGAGLVTHGLNVVLPTLSAEYNLDYAQLLLWATPASWAGIAASYLCAKMTEKWGAKFTILICVFFAAISYAALGWASSITAFVIFFSGVAFFGSGFAYIAGPALVANWFPMKKDLAFGWTTVGQSLSSAFYVPVLVLFLGIFGSQYGFAGMSAILLAVFVLIAIFTTNKPEEIGCYPDNDPDWQAKLIKSQAKAESAAAGASKAVDLSTAGLLRSKDIWLLGLGAGGVYIILVGVLSQLVPRLISMGYDLNTAIFYMSLSALIGTIGSPVWGWLAQRISTKMALIVYEVWWIVAIVLNMISNGNEILLWASLVMIGLSLGGATNLTTSVVAGKYPREAFAKAFGVVSPIQSVVRCFAFSILAFGLNYLGGYTGAYALLVGIGVITMILYWLVDPTPVE